MDDNLNMLMRRLLDESAAQREQLSNMLTTMFSKADFARFEDRLDERLSEWDTKLGKVVHAQVDQEQRLKVVTHFRNSVVSGGAWMTRAAIVAGLGIIATLLPYHFGIAESARPIATPTPTPIVTPLIVPTPEYVPHIKKLRH